MQMRFPNYASMIGPTYVGMASIYAHEGTIGLVLIGQGRSQFVGQKTKSWLPFSGWLREATGGSIVQKVESSVCGFS